MAHLLHDVSLVVFARAPVPGRVKTRLVAPGGLSPAAAARLHGAFVRDVCRAGALSGLGRRRLYIADGDPAQAGAAVAAGATASAGDADQAGADAAAVLASAGDADQAAAAAAALASAGDAAGFLPRAQGPGDLGARMARAIRAELADRAAAVVLVGSDSPTLPPALLREAGEALRGAADLVLGPAADGGYWLVGARLPCDELFAPPMAWGTPEVLPATLERLAGLQAAGRAVHLLPFLYDVDTPADLRLLRAELRLRPDAAPATRALLLELGLL